MELTKSHQEFFEKLHQVAENKIKKMTDFEEGKQYQIQIKINVMRGGPDIKCPTGCGKNPVTHLCLCIDETP